MSKAIMKLDSCFYLDTDKNNYILRYESKSGEINKKTGKEILKKDFWYYPKLNQALSKYINESLKPCENILSLNQKINELESLILTIKQK